MVVYDIQHFIKYNEYILILFYKKMGLGKYFLTNIKENKLPLFLAFSGLIFPFLVYQHVNYKTRKLNQGIKNEMLQFEQRGKRYSDIKQTKYEN